MTYNLKKVGQRGPKETVYVNQEVGKHVEKITVNEWFAGRMEGE